MRLLSVAKAVLIILVLRVVNARQLDDRNELGNAAHVRRRLRLEIFHWRLALSGVGRQLRGAFGLPGQHRLSERVLRHLKVPPNQAKLIKTFSLVDDKAQPKVMVH